MRGCYALLDHADISLANHENEETINGEKASDVVAYLDRLYNAKRHVEARINLLGGAGEVSSVGLIGICCAES